MEIQKSHLKIEPGSLGHFLGWSQAYILIVNSFWNWIIILLLIRISRLSISNLQCFCNTSHMGLIITMKSPRKTRRHTADTKDNPEPRSSNCFIVIVESVYIPIRHNPKFDQQKSEKVWDLWYHIGSITFHWPRFCFDRLILVNNSRCSSKHYLCLHHHIGLLSAWYGVLWYQKTVMDGTGRSFQVLPYCLMGYNSLVDDYQKGC